MRVSGNHSASLRTHAGFSLIEVLVVIALVTALFGVLLPMLSASLERARSYQCQMAQRAVAFDFQIFADNELHGDRGDDHDRTTFQIETFQESQYGVDEFWRWGQDQSAHQTPDSNGNDPMRCPSVSQSVTLRNNLACSAGAIGPPQGVSFGFNARLNRIEVLDSRGRPRAIKARLRSSILQQSSVPLLIDIDGQQALTLGVNPLYTAPSLDSRGPYAGDRVWFPGTRHNGHANAAFMDGHVASSSDPEHEPGWRWDFQPTR